MFADIHPAGLQDGGSRVAPQARAAALIRGWIPFLGVSAIALVPCFWTSRIHAGDLGSHLYNAWLAQLASAGRLPGVFLAHPSNNVLFDWMLTILWPLGPRAAERAAVGLSVLVFIWGAFAFVSGYSRRRSWHALPPLLVLAYGWVFQMGFLNYYLALGLSLYALALIPNPRLLPRLAACPLLLLAWLGNPIPVLWAMAAALYGLLLRRLPPRLRWGLPAAAALLLSVSGFWLGARLPSRWTPAQLWWVSGADQLWLYGSSYLLVALAFLLVSSIWAWLALSRRDAPVRSANLPFHLVLLAAFGSFILPNAVLIPGNGHALTYIPERLSLITAISAAALFAQIRPPAAVRVASYLIAGVFFAFLFRDARSFDRAESALARTLSAMPPMARVVAPLTAPGWRIDPYTHMLDRACIGRCYSFANYEPCSAAFRVHCAPRNAYVVDNYRDSFAIQTGEYVVMPKDHPIYEVYPCPSPPGVFCFRALSAGQRLQPRPVFR